MKKYWPEVLVGVVEIALVVMQNTELVSYISKDSGVALVRIISFQMVLFFLYVLLRLSLVVAENNLFRSRIEKEVNLFARNANSVVPLHEDDFYLHMMKYIRKAEKSVALAQLDVRPPKKIPGSSGSIYYNKFIGLVKSNRSVRFQRVERVSREKVEWIESLIGSLEGNVNFSLRCVNYPGQPDKTGNISVQLIDDLYTFLVAIPQHYFPHTNRDLLLFGKDVNELWRRYYDDVLWEMGEPIIEDGIFYSDRWEQLKSDLGV